MRSLSLRFIFCLYLAVSSAAALAKVPDSQCSYPTIRFYTGNLSVGQIQEYWGTGTAGPGDFATPEYSRQIREVGVSASCDYLAWPVIEPEPGKWDWSIYDRNERILHGNGLAYSVYCWLHFPPKWFMKTPDYVPYRCLEHDEPVMQTSLWAPGTLKMYERFYKELAQHFGDKIDFIRLAMPAEYGEVGYPCGMTDWLVKQEHVHSGYWCNDRYARADFREKMRSRHHTIGRLNAAWGTGFASFGEIEYPLEQLGAQGEPLTMKPGDRRWILDFIGWYYESQSEFARKAVGIVSRCFPGKEIILSMGYGAQCSFFGNDDVGIAKLCGELGVACQSPGGMPQFVMKSLASPCRFYGVPFYTEPPANVDANAQVNRIWSDASSGVSTFFDYPQNLFGAKDVFAKYGGFLDGEQPVVDMAVFFPTTDHRLRIEGWPRRTYPGASLLRELIDYDLVDERMIQDGALGRFKLLVIYDGNVMESKTLFALEKWLCTGGLILIRDFGPVETVEGDTSYYRRLFPRPHFAGEVSVDSLLKSNSKRIGRGMVLTAPGSENNETQFALLTSQLAHNLSKYFPGRHDVPLLDGLPDGIQATLFADKILFLNPGDKRIERYVELRPEDFSGDRTGRPSGYEHRLAIESHSISVIPLRR